MTEKRREWGGRNVLQLLELEHKEDGTVLELGLGRGEPSAGPGDMWV